MELKGSGDGCQLAIQQEAEAAAERRVAAERKDTRRVQEEAESLRAEGMAALHEAADQLAAHQV